MKVIHLISGGDSGGGKTHVFTLLNKLKEQVNIELICLIRGPFYDEACELGIPSTLMEQKTRFDVSVVRSLADKINNEGIDLLHCHGARANFVAALLKRKVSIPLLTTVHSDYTQDFTHNLYKRLIFTTLNRFGLNRMDYYLAVTNVFKDMLVEQGFNKDKIYTIYNGISIGNQTVVDKAYTGSDMVFGCVTTLRPIKGTHILLESIKTLVDEGYQVKLLIAGIGQGKYVEELHNYVKVNKLEAYVEFRGFVKDMDAFYKEIHVNILPSFTESFPYALLEGGIRKKGTIASRVGGVVEMIKDGVSGRLVESANPKALAAAMVQAIENPDRFIGYGETFYQAILERFTDEAMANRHLLIYKELIKKSKT